MMTDRWNEYPEDTYNKLVARADRDTPDPEFVTPVYTKRGMVAVSARVERDGMYWASAVTTQGDTVRVDAVGVVVDPDDPRYGYQRLTESASCTYSELANEWWKSEDFGPERQYRTRRVDNLVRVVTYSPVSRDPFRKPVEGLDEPADGQPIAAHIFRTILQAGATFPPAVLEAGLTLVDSAE